MATLTIYEDPRFLDALYVCDCSQWKAVIFFPANPLEVSIDRYYFEHLTQGHGLSPQEASRTIVQLGGEPQVAYSR